MKKFFNKFFNSCRFFFYGLFYGMRKAEDIVLTPLNNSSDDSGIYKEVHEERVSKALLKGEITQQVIDLRYRTYEVDKKSKTYEYFSPTLARNNKTKDSKKVKYENEDNREVVLIQPNHAIVENIGESLSRLDSKDRVKENFLINIKRNFTPRFRIEEFTTKLVVKRGDDDTTAVLDFYVPKYKSDTNFRLNAFLTDVVNIKEKWVRSDTLDFNSVFFITSHAYRVNDMFSFRFDDPVYLETIEYDGSYILRFVAKIFDGGTDLTNEYFSENMAKKYENKEPKNLTGEIVIRPDGKTTINEECDSYGRGGIKRVYKCEICGKEIVYDAKALDNLNPTPVSDENTENIDGYLEYADAEISEMTFGKKMCKECLAKYIEKQYNNSINKK